jgi:hypothetical protein
MRGAGGREIARVRKLRTKVKGLKNHGNYDFVRRILTCVNATERRLRSAREVAA